MKYLFILITLTSAIKTTAQKFDHKSIQHFEAALGDVMEIIDKELVIKKLNEVESQYKTNPNELNSVRLGLIYHEASLNLTFFNDTKKYAGYAQKSYDVLTKLSGDKSYTKELSIYIESYRASAIALVAAETKKLKLLNTAFQIFEKAIDTYAEVSPRPEFMRGSVAENLPFFMWKKKKYAKIDFESIVKKQKMNPNYADFRIMSFTYWGWAKAYKKRKFRKQAIEYLNQAIKIDPNYKAGRKRAEELKEKYLK